jgi:diaphanous 1
MSTTNPMIVPTVLVTGSLHFAEVHEKSTAQDVIDALVSVNEVTNEILGDLEDYGWALQRIRVEQYGRPWEEEELEALGDGKVSQVEIWRLLKLA